MHCNDIGPTLLLLALTTNFTGQLMYWWSAYDYCLVDSGCH